MTATLRGPRRFVVLLVIHDPQNIDQSWIKHTANQTVAVVADIKHHTVANLIS
jgi:hypothetical protein